MTLRFLNGLGFGGDVDGAVVGGFRGFAAVVIGAVVICCRGFAAER
jgi:hypothetical protein